MLALALSWAALRMMWTEVLQSRRENAADRAAAAAAYRNLFTVRAAEHAEFTTAMTERLAQAHLAQRELEGLVVQHETRAQRAESKLRPRPRPTPRPRVGSGSSRRRSPRSQPTTAPWSTWSPGTSRPARRPGREEDPLAQAGLTLRADPMRLLLLPAVAVLLAGCGSERKDAETADPAPATDTRLLGLNHAAVEVPDSWATNESSCGTPMVDTVVVDVAASPLCYVRVRAVSRASSSKRPGRGTSRPTRPSRSTGSGPSVSAPSARAR